MGTFQDIREAIETRFINNWTATRISIDNVAFTADSEESFVKIMIEELPAYQVTMGTKPCHRFPGIIHIMIFVPVGTGTNIARGYADSISDIFRNADFDDIQCRTTRLVRVGDVGEHFQYSALTNFWKDEALANAS